ncbi:MAG: DUF169 domain-containing protein [Chloroflexi bacterium]|nr:DUF169 domain-containing protein [Chloroflexota bacterium]
MADLHDYQRWGEVLERSVRLKTYSLAVKMLEDEAQAPAGAFRPLRDLGHHLSLCQAYQLSRRNGTTVAMLKEDNWCFEPVVGYGLGVPPQYFLDGYNRYPRDVENLEAGRHYAEEFPRLEAGKYVGVVSAPLGTVTFEPDAVLVYCDTAQLSLLMLAREYKDGRNLKSALSSHAACVYGLIPALQTGECTVAVPCRGDHYHAMAGDEEMIFTVPRGKLAELMDRLKYVASTGSKLPRAYTIHPEYQLPEAYAKIADMMGYLRK